MPNMIDVRRRRVSWSLSLEACRLVRSYTQKFGGEDRFNADFLIQRGAEAVGHKLTPEDYRIIADEIEKNEAERERLRASGRFKN